MIFNNNKFKEFRKSKKLKLKNLAEVIGRTYGALRYWEIGARTPSESDIRMLAKAMKIPVSDISDLNESTGNSRVNEKDTAVLLNKNLYALDKLIDEMSNNSDNNVHILKELKSVCIQYQQTNTYLETKVNSYEKILSQITPIVYIKDENYKFKYVNKAFMLTAGKYNYEDIIGNKAFDIYGMKEITDVHQIEQMAFSKNIVIKDRKIKIPSLTGNKVGLLTVTPTVDESGKNTEIICSIKDITDMSFSLDKLARLKNVINTSDECIIITFLDSNKIDFISRGATKLTGYEPNEFYDDRKKWSSLIHKDDISKIHFNWNDPKSLPRTYKHRIIDKYGNLKWVEVKILLSSDCSGRPIVFTLARDITQQVIQNAKLELLKSNIESYRDGISIVDLTNRKFVFRNKAIERITGYSDDMVHKYGDIDHSSEHFVMPAYRNKLVEVYKQYGSIKKPVEYQIRKADDSTCWLELTFTNKTIDNSRYQFRVIRDISEFKKQTEIYDLLKKLLDESALTIWLFNTEKNKLVYVSKSVKKLYGYPPSQFKNHFNFWFNSCVHDDDKAKEKEYSDSIKPWPKKRKFKIIRADGEVRKIESNVFLNDIYKLEYQQDITE